MPFILQGFLGLTSLEALGSDTTHTGILGDVPLGSTLGEIGEVPSLKRGGAGASLWGLECHVQSTGTSPWGAAKGLWRSGDAPGDGLEQQMGGEVNLPGGDTHKCQQMNSAWVGVGFVACSL